MLEPKKILVGLAGQKAWHICVGEAAPRISGKYFPSQLRTQKAGPELAATCPDGHGCGSLLKILPNSEAGDWCFWPPPKKKSSRFSAELISGASATGIPTAATATMRRNIR